jgi:hypothetical protein
MMPTSHELPSYVSDLLEAERRAPRPSAEVERRVRARVAATLVATAVTAAGATSLTASSATAATAAGAAVKTGGLIALGAKLSVLVIGVGVIGTAGIASYRHHLASETKTVAARRTMAHQAASSSPRMPTRVLVEPLPAAPVASETAAASPLLPTLPTLPTAPTEGSSTVATVRAAEVPRRGAPRDPGTLAEESPLIDRARAQLGAGKPSLALLLLGQHARRFGHGQLAEEREALWVQALVANGNTEEARTRAVQFRRHFPRSIQIEIVNAAIHSIH